MNREKSDEAAKTCLHCGKNLKVLKGVYAIIESDGKRFCSYSCAALKGVKLKQTRRSYRS